MIVILLWLLQRVLELLFVLLSTLFSILFYSFLRKSWYHFFKLLSFQKWSGKAEEKAYIAGTSIDPHYLYTTTFEKRNLYKSYRKNVEHLWDTFKEFLKLNLKF